MIVLIFRDRSDKKEKRKSRQEAHTLFWYIFYKRKKPLWMPIRFINRLHGAQGLYCSALFSSQRMGRSGGYGMEKNN